MFECCNLLSPFMFQRDKGQYWGISRALNEPEILVKTRSQNVILLIVYLRWRCRLGVNLAAPLFFLHSHHMRRYSFYLKNHFRNFHHIFTFRDPLSQKNRFSRKCLSSVVGRILDNSRFFFFIIQNSNTAFW